MITKFDYNGKELYTPIIFRSDFQDANLSVAQAWSLFFTAGQEENGFAKNRELAWFWTNIILAVVATDILWALWFSSPIN